MSQSNLGGSPVQNGLVLTSDGTGKSGWLSIVKPLWKW